MGKAPGEQPYSSRALENFVDGSTIVLDLSSMATSRMQADPTINHQDS